jgi:hypothetical protein
MKAVNTGWSKSVKGTAPLVLTRIFRSAPVNTDIIQGHALLLIQSLQS